MSSHCNVQRRVFLVAAIAPMTAQHRPLCCAPCPNASHEFPPRHAAEGGRGGFLPFPSPSTTRPCCHGMVLLGFGVLLCGLAIVPRLAQGSGLERTTRNLRLPVALRFASSRPHAVAPVPRRGTPNSLLDEPPKIHIGSEAARPRNRPDAGVRGASSPMPGTPGIGALLLLLGASGIAAVSGRLLGWRLRAVPRRPPAEWALLGVTGEGSPLPAGAGPAAPANARAAPAAPISRPVARDAAPGQAFVCQVSGPDRAGLAADVVAALEAEHMEVLDVQQQAAHGRALLSLMLLNRGAEPVGMDTAAAALRALAPHAECTPVARAAYEEWARRRAGPRWIVTLLTRQLRGGYIAAVTRALADDGLRVARITPLSAPVDLQAPAAPGIRAVELCVEGQALDPRAVRARLAALCAELPIDASFQSDDLFRGRRRLAVFDMDSTLVQCEVRCACPPPENYTSAGHTSEFPLFVSALTDIQILHIHMTLMTVV